jgi:hypothetical protein
MTSTGQREAEERGALRSRVPTISSSHSLATTLSLCWPLLRSRHTRALVVSCTLMAFADATDRKPPMLSSRMLADASSSNSPWPKL